MTAHGEAVARAAPPRLNDMSLFRQQAHVDGAWIDTDSGGTINVANPGTGEVMGAVPKLGAAETRRAVETAERAWSAFRRVPAGALPLATPMRDGGMRGD